MSISISNVGSIRDYLAGEMSDAEREAFEGRLLTDINLVRDLEESLQLREGLELLREEKVLEELLSPRRRTMRVRFAWASAAVAAAIFISVSLYFGKHSLPVVGTSVAALSPESSPVLRVVEHYAFAELRAGATAPEIALPRSGALELRALTPVTDASKTFQVTLDHIQEQRLTRVGAEVHLVPDTDGFVVIYANVSRLKPGYYLLTVERDGAPELVGAERFTFRLVQTETAPSRSRP